MTPEEQAYLDQMETILAAMMDTITGLVAVSPDGSPELTRALELDERICDLRADVLGLRPRPTGGPVSDNVYNIFGEREGVEGYVVIPAGPSILDVDDLALLSPEEIGRLNVGPRRVDAAGEAGLTRFRAYSRERAEAVAAEGGTVPDDSLDVGRQRRD